MIGNLHRIRDGFEMAEKPFLGRLVVIRRHEQRRIAAQLLGGHGEFDGLARRVRAVPPMTLQRPFANLHSEFDDPQMFLVTRESAIRRSFRQERSR